MGLDILTLGASKTYTNQVALGIGNMRVEGTTVYFTIAATGEETSITLPTPKDGVSIESIEITDDNRLVCTMSDGTFKECEIDLNAEKIEYTTNADATIKNVKNALDKLVSKSDSELEEALTANVAMGQVTVGRTFPKGTPLEDIIREMLTEKLPPAVTITLNPSTLLYDAVTGSISSLTINTNVIKKTYDIEKVEFYINDILVHTTTSGVTNGGSFPYIYNTVINDDTVIKVIATDKEGLKTTQIKTITFIGQSYYGIVDATIGEPTEALVKTLNKTLKNSKKFLYEGITCDYNKVVYAYPSELGKLTSIMDKVNNFNYTSSFQLTTKTIDNIEYYIYTLIDPTGADGVTLTFE